MRPTHIHPTPTKPPTSPPFPTHRHNHTPTHPHTYTYAYIDIHTHTHQHTQSNLYACKRYLSQRPLYEKETSICAKETWDNSTVRTMCCSVLQLCFSVFQVCWSVIQDNASVKTMCCSVLQCVAIVLLCIFVCCMCGLGQFIDQDHVLQVCCTTLHYVALYCSVSCDNSSFNPCDTVWCNVKKWVAVCCSMVQYISVWPGSGHAFKK